MPINHFYMIMSMRFIDNDTSFEVSELTENRNINIYMSEVGEEIGGKFITLGEVDIVRLRDFLNESIKSLD